MTYTQMREIRKNLPYLDSRNTPGNPCKMH